jgi:hypothetical protein
MLSLAKNLDRRTTGALAMAKRWTLVKEPYRRTVIDLRDALITEKQEVARVCKPIRP